MLTIKYTDKVRSLFVYYIQYSFVRVSFLTTKITPIDVKGHLDTYFTQHLRVSLITIRNINTVS